MELLQEWSSQLFRQLFNIRWQIKAKNYYQTLYHCTIGVKCLLFDSLSVSAQVRWYKFCQAGIRLVTLQTWIDLRLIYNGLQVTGRPILIYHTALIYLLRLFKTHTFCRYKKLTISKLKTVNLHERLIEKLNFIKPPNRQFLIGAVMRSAFYFFLIFDIVCPMDLVGLSISLIAKSMASFINAFTFGFL